MRDVAERPGVHQHRRVLERLQKVRLDGVAHDHRHRATGVKEVGRDRFAVARQTDHHAPEPLPHVLQRRREREHRHDLRGGGDVESCLPRHAVLGRTQADHDTAQHPVTHVQHATPRDAVQVDWKIAQAVVDVVVDHRGQQVVGRGDGVKIAGKVQIQPLHRHHLAVAAAGGATLDAESRAHRRLADGHGRALANPPERVAQPDRGRRLAFAERRRGDRRDNDVLRLRPAFQLVDGVQPDLRDVMAVRLQQVLADAHTGGDLGHREQARAASDLEVGRKSHCQVVLLMPRAAWPASPGASARWPRSR